MRMKRRRAARTILIAQLPANQMSTAPAIFQSIGMRYSLATESS